MYIYTKQKAGRVRVVEKNENRGLRVILRWYILPDTFGAQCYFKLYYTTTIQIHKIQNRSKTTKTKYNNIIISIIEIIMIEKMIYFKVLPSTSFNNNIFFQ